jgi:hypothetical protein
MQDSELVERLRQDAEMLGGGWQGPTLTELWHSDVVRDAATDCAEAAARIEALSQSEQALRDENERLREEMADIAAMAEYRIQDGIEMGATVWRIALADIAADARRALTAPDNDGEGGCG